MSNGKKSVRYTEQKKKEIISFFRKTNNKSETMRKYGIAYETLSNWLKKKTAPSEQRKKDVGVQLSPKLKAELKDLYSKWLVSNINS